jgi:eukaryotic-like serine/threonine-protein kinase
MAESQQTRRAGFFRLARLSSARRLAPRLRAPVECQTGPRARTLPSRVRIHRGVIGSTGAVVAALGLVVSGPAVGALPAPAGGSAGGASRGLSASTALSVVLANFDNLSAEDGLAETLSSALAIVLGQSPFVSLLPDRERDQALTRMGLTPDQPLGESAARTLCAQTDSRAVLSGRVRHVDGFYQIELTAFPCTGDASPIEVQGSAASRAELLQALSEASFALRARLGEPAASIRRFKVPLSATTDSLTALVSYSIGMKVRREQGDTASVPDLERAVELDPRFALAYATLAGVYGNLRQPTLALACATKAYRWRARGSERQQLQISAAYFRATGQIEKELQTYQRWQTQYPRDLVPRNNLGNVYAAIGRLRDALSEYQDAQALAPSVVGYTNIGGMYLSLNRFADAGRTFSEALANRFDGRYIHQSIYWLAFVQGDRRLMERQVVWAAGRPRDEDVLWSMESDTDAYYGRRNDARVLTRRAVESAVRANEKEAAALWQVNGALRESELGDAEAARTDVAAALALASGREVTVIAALTLARAGDALGAASLLHSLERQYAYDSLLRLYWLPCIRAALAIGEGEPSRAVRHLSAAAAYELGGAGTFINYLYPAYLRGQAYLMLHESQAAIREFEKLQNHPGIVLNFVTGALTHLQLARCYVMAGDGLAASKAYKDFFSLWTYADRGVPVLGEAQREWSHLQPLQ